MRYFYRRFSNSSSTEAELYPAAWGTCPSHKRFGNSSSAEAKLYPAAWGIPSFAKLRYIMLHEVFLLSQSYAISCFMRYSSPAKMTTSISCCMTYVSASNIQIVSTTKTISSQHISLFLFSQSYAISCFMRYCSFRKATLDHALWGFPLQQKRRYILLHEIFD